MGARARDITGLGQVFKGFTFIRSRLGKGENQSFFVRVLLSWIFIRSNFFFGWADLNEVTFVVEPKGAVGQVI